MIGGVYPVKKLSILLLTLMLCLFSTVSPAETEGDFVYSIHDGQAIITAYTGNASELVIPDTLGGCPVTSIRYCAFRECVTLTRITLAHGITSIGSNAFQGCSSLRHIDLPDSLAAIGTHAFYGCPELTLITIPDSIQRIHPYAFYGCSATRQCSLNGPAALVLTDFGYSFTCPEYPLLALKAYEDDSGLRAFTVADCHESAVNVTFPAGVTAIDRYAFFECASLAEITIPEGVREIPHAAFDGCASLAQVTLPGSVAKIEDSAFARCPNITILSPAGSAAQAFAEAHAENGFIWLPL